MVVAFDGGLKEVGMWRRTFQYEGEYDRHFVGFWGPKHELHLPCAYGLNVTKDCLWLYMDQSPAVNGS